MKVIKFILIVFAISGLLNREAFGQTIRGKDFKKDGKFGFFFGLNNNSFARNEKILWNSINRTYSPGLTGGLHFRPYFWKVISSYAQISFTQKGATENFEITNIEQLISVRTNLNYGQVEIVPLEFIPFPKKNLSPYISVGFFFSKLYSSKIRYQYTEKFETADDTNHFILDFEPTEKADKGYAFIAGLKFENFRLELRNEISSTPIYQNTNIKNHSNSLILRYSL